MEHRLEFEISPQPDLTTCGPTCLQAIYGYFLDDVDLSDMIREIPRLPGGGTLAVYLGLHALRRGYAATLYTYDLKLFDPTWFPGSSSRLRKKLTDQMEFKAGEKFRLASRAFLEFLQEGGKLRMEDLTGHLIRSYLKKKIPILVGLSATYLYREKRELSPSGEPDDIRGESQGHFVVLCGYDPPSRTVLVADPLTPNPQSADHYYAIPLGHVLSSIMLGILTYDANLLVIQQVRRRMGPRHENPDRDGAP